jgi:hypothetical protein
VSLTELLQTQYCKFWNSVESELGVVENMVTHLLHFGVNKSAHSKVTLKSSAGMEI